MPYRYEDLGDKAFQRLCASILVHLDMRVQVPPLGQSDGGFDAFARDDGSLTKRIGHQVKWTAYPDRIKNPVTWISATLNGEKENLRRMAAEGTEAYLLITNVPSTSRPKVGRLDLMYAALAKLGKEVGLTIRVWWRSDLDARIDAAPPAIKFEYPDMLVGADAMRALLDDALQGTRVKRYSAILKSAARTAWDSDRTVGFRQGQLDGVSLDALFVDVTATKVLSSDENRRERGEQGALELLMSASAPSRSMIFGAPGQGKSTLIQKLCQEHRRLLLEPGSEAQSTDEDVPRITFKIVLRDYAQWITGLDPFELNGKKRPSRLLNTVESFTAHMLRHDSGGQACEVDDVVQIGNRFPTLFAFDGLDEVADVVTRGQAVDEINAFTARVRDWQTSPRIVVTSRPSFDRLPEPNSDVFVGFALNSLSEELRITYLRKWAQSQELSPRDRREIERIFRERSGQSHVRELATNPMQLTILLYLIRQRGDSIPQRRTELYAGYLQSFLDREAAMSPTIKLRRDALEEVTAFLGWHLQSSAESANGTGRAPRAELKREMKYFLVDNDRDVALVDELFTAVTTRVWALVSRVEGTFEFDVQSIREYFAARYLFDRSPTSQTAAGVFNTFLETAARPYWANTARFMSGLFRYGEKAQLADDLIAGIDESKSRFWPRRFGQTLVQDGIFDDQLRSRRRLIESCFDEIGLRIAVRDIDSGSTRPIPADRGGAEIIEALRSAIEASPNAPLALERARLLSDYQDERTTSDWWLSSARNDMENVTRWLQIGLAASVGQLLSVKDAEHFDAVTGAADVSLLLQMGVKPDPSGPLASAMLRSVLDGWTASEDLPGRTHAAALARFVDLPLLVDRAAPGIEPFGEWDKQASAILRSHNEPSGKALARARATKAGQKGTTIWFAEFADVIQQEYGRCWLAIEVALIGASSNVLRKGHLAPRDSLAFGPCSLPSALLRDVRDHAGDVHWWMNTARLLADELDRAAWVLGVLTSEVTLIGELLDHFIAMVEGLTPPRRQSLWRALDRLAANQHLCSIQPSSIRSVADTSPDTAALLSALADHADDQGPIMDASQILQVTAGVARNHLIRDFWRNLPIGFENDAAALELLADGPTDLMLVGHQRTPAPPELEAAIKAQSPWALLQWVDSGIEDTILLQPLRQVADSQGWFTAAS